MAVASAGPYTSLQITMPAPHHSVFTGQMPFLPPTNSVKALKAVHTGNYLSICKQPRPTQVDPANSTSITSVVYARLMPYVRYTLKLGCETPLTKLRIPQGIPGPSNAWFLGPIQLHTPNDSSIYSAVSAGLMGVHRHRIDKYLDTRRPVATAADHVPSDHFQK